MAVTSGAIHNRIFGAPGLGRALGQFRSRYNVLMIGTGPDCW